jgi:hypothetical protein
MRNAKFQLSGLKSGPDAKRTGFLVELEVHDVARTVISAGILQRRQVQLSAAFFLPFLQQLDCLVDVHG